MKLFLNNEGLVDYDKITKNTTVEEFINAIDVFLKENPVDCVNCKKHCCKKKWRIEVDNVFLNRSPNKKYFLEKNLNKKFYFLNTLEQNILPVVVLFNPCKYLNGLNKCEIYKNRPLICRLYQCYPETERFSLLRSLIGGVFYNALTIEISILLSGEKHFDNPVLGMQDYNIPIKKILPYAEQTLEDNEKKMFLTL